jgi:hypothetical protein
MLMLIMALIVSMMIVRLAIIAIGFIALMIVAIFTTTMLTVAQFMALHGKKMSRFLFLWLSLVLGNLLENASHLFKSVNLFWCNLGCAKKICSLFSCAMGTSIVQRR